MFANYMNSSNLCFFFFLFVILSCRRSHTLKSTEIADVTKEKQAFTMRWLCKLCLFRSARRLALLKRYRLTHIFSGHGRFLPCFYSDFPNALFISHSAFKATFYADLWLFLALYLFKFKFSLHLPKTLYCNNLFY